MSRKLKCLAIWLICAQLSGCVAVVAGGAAGGAAMANDRRTAGTILDDNSIEIKVHNSISDNGVISKNSRIIVVSYNNIVLLVGQTPTYEMRQEAERLAAEVPKVRHVYNEIEVRRTPLPVAVQNNDSWITAKIKSVMMVNKDVPASRIKIVTEDGIVYMLGLIREAEEGEAVRIARETKGVQKVIKLFEYIRE